MALMEPEATFLRSCGSLLEVEVKGNRDSKTMLEDKKKKKGPTRRETWGLVLGMHLKIN